MKLGSALVVALGIGALASAANDQGPAHPANLVGTWRLVAYEDRPDQGPPQFPYGASPQRILIYDATGHMAVQIMKIPHP
jgi:Lipocalin-like domain